jgi:hypothetical protein
VVLDSSSDTTAMYENQAAIAPVGPPQMPRRGKKKYGFHMHYERKKIAAWRKFKMNVTENLHWNYLIG